MWNFLDNLNKALESAKINGLLVAAVDANEQFKSRARCCGDCCQRQIKVSDDSGQVVVQAHLDAFGVKPGFEKLEIGPALKLAAQERAVALKCSAFVGF